MWGEAKGLIFIFYRIEKGRRHGEWVILGAAQSLFAARRISQRATWGCDASNRFLRRRRRQHQKASAPVTASSPLLLDMKVQQGCNSSDMGIPVTTEEELRRNTVITPEDVLGLQKITKSKSPAAVIGTMRRVVKAFQLGDYCDPSVVASFLYILYILHITVHHIRGTAHVYHGQRHSLKSSNQRVLQPMSTSSFYWLKCLLAYGASSMVGFPYSCVQVSDQRCGHRKRAG